MLANRLTGPEDAPVVLYLHGLGVAGWCWEPVSAALPDHAALVPDLPGHAGSRDIPWRSIADTADQLAALVDTLPADRPVHVTGHSLGGYLGATLIALRPKRFESALLSGFHIGALGNRRLLKLAFAINGLLWRVPPLLRLLAPRMGDAETTRRFIEGTRNIRPDTIRRAGSQVVEFKTPFAPGPLPCPTLIVAADGEPRAIRTTPDRLAAQHPNVTAKLLENRDHLWPLKEPKLYADLLSAHLGRNR
ncbi:MAG: alpha/beta fold hydrolase [Pseudomonadota bacterium]